MIFGFYGLMLYGIFGDKTKGSSFCFAIFLITVTLNALLVIVFNTSYTKKTAIDLVGFKFYEKYLSHSAPALKSFTRLLGPTGFFYLYDISSPLFREKSHQRAVTELLLITESVIIKWVIIQ